MLPYLIQAIFSLTLSSYAQGHAHVAILEPGIIFLTPSAYVYAGSRPCKFHDRPA
jgi:hypothetical protein